jgi:hypothetical protein
MSNHNVALCSVCAVERSFPPGSGTPDRFCSTERSDRHVSTWSASSSRQDALAVHGEIGDLVSDESTEELYEYDSPEFDDEE